jgi:hypothetical protein
MLRRINEPENEAVRHRSQGPVAVATSVAYTGNTVRAMEFGELPHRFSRESFSGLPIDRR